MSDREQGGREEGVARFKRLTEVELPERARRERWPLRLDHCFKRVCLDWACGGRWYDRIARPAERHIDGALLAGAVGCAEELLRGDALMLGERNVASLRWRGKLKPRGGEASEHVETEAGWSAAKDGADASISGQGRGRKVAEKRTASAAPASRSVAKKANKAKKLKKAALPTKKMEADAELRRMSTTPMSQCAAVEGAPATRFAAGAMRLGFAVKVMGQPGLKSNDTRRWQQVPHLRVSLGYLCEIFGYLRKHGIHMYRMSSDLAPYATHPEMPQFHAMVRESAADLAHVGRMAREQDLRLSFHPSQFVVLNSENEALTRRSMWDLESQAEMLDRMECGPEAVLVVHVGGAYGDRESGWRRWASTWPRLGEPVQRRLVLENDDIRYSAADVLKVHEATGVKCVWDYQHHWCFNPEGLEMVATLRRFCATWPKGVRPKMHFSCARTEMREIKRKSRQTGRVEVVLQPPIWTGHADYNNPFEAITFLRSIADVDVDVMLESKAKDLSLIRLRNDLARYAPELAPRYGIDLGVPVEDVGEVVEAADEV